MYTQVHVNVSTGTGEFKGSGSTWGVAAGLSRYVGTLFYNSEDTLLSAENDFYMISITVGVGAAGMVFVIDGNAVGFLLLGGGGLDWAFAYGKFAWS